MKFEIFRGGGAFLPRQPLLRPPRSQPCSETKGFRPHSSIGVLQVDSSATLCQTLGIPSQHTKGGFRKHPWAKNESNAPKASHRTCQSWSAVACWFQQQQQQQHQQTRPQKRNGFMGKSFPNFPRLASPASQKQSPKHLYRIPMVYKCAHNNNVHTSNNNNEQPLATPNPPPPPPQPLHHRRRDRESSAHKSPRLPRLGALGEARRQESSRDAHLVR